MSARPIRGLMIGGITLDKYTSLTYSQTYEEFGGETIVRMLNGAAYKQVHWRKLRTVISGSGGFPHGLASLDLSEPVAVRGAASMCATKSSNIIPISRAYRMDAGFQPEAHFFNGKIWVSTPCSGATGAAGNITCTTAPSAIMYRVTYFPLITGYIVLPVTQGYSSDSGEYNWSITVEEI